jgi:hypothetical protein
MFTQRQFTWHTKSKDKSSLELSRLLPNKNIYVTRCEEQSGVLHACKKIDSQGARLPLEGLCGRYRVQCSETREVKGLARGPETALQPARSAEMKSCALAQRALCISADLNTQVYICRRRIRRRMAIKVVIACLGSHPNAAMRTVT